MNLNDLSNISIKQKSTAMFLNDNTHNLKPNFWLIISILTTILLAGCVSQPTKPADPETQQLENNIANNPNDFESIGRLADWNYEKYSTSKNRQYRKKAITLYEDFLRLQPNHTGAANALYRLNLDIALNENYSQVRNNGMKLFQGF